MLDLRRAWKEAKALHVGLCDSEPHPSPPCLEGQEGEEGKDSEESKEEKNKVLLTEDEADEEGAGDETESEDPGHKPLGRDGGFGDGAAGSAAAVC